MNLRSGWTVMEHDIKIETCEWSASWYLEEWIFCWVLCSPKHQTYPFSERSFQLLASTKQIFIVHFKFCVNVPAEFTSYFCMKPSFLNFSAMVDTERDVILTFLAGFKCFITNIAGWIKYFQLKQTRQTGSKPKIYLYNCQHRKSIECIYLKSWRTIL